MRLHGRWAELATAWVPNMGGAESEHIGSGCEERKHGHRKTGFVVKGAQRVHDVRVRRRRATSLLTACACKQGGPHMSTNTQVQGLRTIGARCSRPPRCTAPGWEGALPPSGRGALPRHHRQTAALRVGRSQAHPRLLPTPLLRLRHSREGRVPSRSSGLKSAPQTSGPSQPVPALHSPPWRPGGSQSGWRGQGP